MEVKVLAVASSGGHWEQLMLLRPLLDRYRVTYATTDRSMALRDGVPDAILLRDCNRNRKSAALRATLQAFGIVRAVRPDVILTTGALPGLLCLIAGRVLGTRTIWLDSVANCERLSDSGRFARLIAGRCLTQWEHVAANDRRVGYAGSVL